MHSAKSKRKFGLQIPSPHNISKGMCIQTNPGTISVFSFFVAGSDAFRYEVMGPNTRVFRTYLDERAIFDANMIGESRDSMEVLLVFVRYPSCDSLHADNFHSYIGRSIFRSGHNICRSNVVESAGRLCRNIREPAVRDYQHSARTCKWCLFGHRRSVLS